MYMLQQITIIYRILLLKNSLKVFTCCLFGHMSKHKGEQTPVSIVEIFGKNNDPPAVGSLLDRNYCYTSVAFYPHDSEWLPVPKTHHTFLPDKISNQHCFLQYEFKVLCIYHSAGIFNMKGKSGKIKMI